MRLCARRNAAKIIIIIIIMYSARRRYYGSTHRVRDGRPEAVRRPAETRAATACNIFVR